MTATAQDSVRSAYNKIAECYLAWCQNRPMLHHEKVQQLLSYLSSQSRVLELGCGAGLPITKILSEHVVEVIANDISDKQIELAMQNAPKATYILGDMTKLTFNQESFDAIVGFYTFFHLPLASFEPLLKDIHSWLKKDGLLLFTYTDHAMNTNSFDFLGSVMYFGGLQVEHTACVVERVGFEIVQQEVRAQGNVEEKDDPDNDVSFLWILARKK